MRAAIHQKIGISELFSTRNRVENVYLHLPFCRKKCHFCAFPVHAIGMQPQNELLDRYIADLK
jgi:coproporphyrinogen III oxidase-like Fe-S oxidoreductase